VSAATSVGTQRQIEDEDEDDWEGGLFFPNLVPKPTQIPGIGRSLALAAIRFSIRTSKLGTMSSCPEKPEFLFPTSKNPTNAVEKEADRWIREESLRLEAPLNAERRTPNAER
jgi:hypothetical protein